jgi:AcrR family transcriptional regulator
MIPLESTACGLRHLNCLANDNETTRVMMQPSDEMMSRVRQAFLAHGFRELSMGGLAAACGYTRRNLYNYFSNKEEAFRALIQYTNADQARRGIEAGRVLLDQGASALDVLTEILVVRFVPVRIRLNNSPHAVEINTEAFRLCHDLMVRSAIVFAGALKTVIVDLEKTGRLQMHAGVTHLQLAQMLTDGVRGINQSLPPVTATALPGRYRLMCRAILYGSATEGAAAASRPLARRKSR